MPAETPFANTQGKPALLGAYTDAAFFQNRATAAKSGSSFDASFTALYVPYAAAPVGIATPFSLASSSAKRISLCINFKGKLALNSPFKIAGIFTSSTPLRAMLACKTSTNFSPATPDPVTSANDSEKASTCKAKIIFIASFTVCPAPFGPNKKNFFPTASKTGITRVNVSCFPPIMKSNSPDSAPQVPPVTGASRKSIPRSAQAAPARRAKSGETVLESINMLPRRNPSITPFAPQKTSSTAGGSLTIVSSTSLAAATSRGLAPHFAPAAIKSSARLFVRFQTVRGNPAFSQLRPMGLPINPSPINPTEVVIRGLPKRKEFTASELKNAWEREIAGLRNLSTSSRT